eukprot:Pompholyxophrys_punicea_v1_NODE_334_length_2224_cov_2.285846.p4 type:complete len:123 gc:universal NODE_334_length_2224_cov_2.285846:1309-1677(+)
MDLSPQPSQNEKEKKTYAGPDDSGADFAHIQRIVVAPATFRVGMDERWILPGLREATVVKEDVSLLELCNFHFSFSRPLVRERGKGGDRANMSEVRFTTMDHWTNLLAANAPPEGLPSSRLA